MPDPETTDCPIAAADVGQPRSVLPDSPPLRVLVLQVWYDERSRRALDPGFTPLHNPELGPAFEAHVIHRALARGEHRGADYFGVLSWKFSRKIPMVAADVRAAIAADRGAADVYSFFGALGSGHVWKRAESKHPGILAAAGCLLRRLGVSRDPADLVAPLIYQNHFICRSTEYERFDRELLAPALAALTDLRDEELQGLLRRDSGYRDGRLTEGRLRTLYGLPYLPLHPFVAERLFSTWLGLNPLLEVRSIWDGRFVEERELAHEPELRGADAR